MINIYGGPVIADIMYEHQYYRQGGAAQVLRHNHLANWKEGGLTGVVLQAGAIEILAMIVSEIDRSEGELVFVTTRDEFLNRPEGSFGLFVSAEGVGSFGGDLDALHILSQLGLTAFTFSHNLQNALCTGGNERYEGGFTHLGKATLKELESLPLMVDLVHMSRASFWDALEIYDGDIFVSHSGADAVCPHPRNLTDEQITAVAERHGVVGLNAARFYVSSTPAKATISDYLDHAMHIYELVGPQHICIGADYFDAPAELWTGASTAAIDPEGKHGLKDNTDLYLTGPRGMENPGKLNNVAKGLAERGLRQDEIDLICGGAYLDMLERTRPSVAT